MVRDRKRPCEIDYERNSAAGILMTTAPLV
jgi:hypothetical protein